MLVHPHHPGRRLSLRRTWSTAPTDINTNRVDFAAYHPHSASGLADSANGTKLLPDMYGGPNRYFAAWRARAPSP